MAQLRVFVSHSSNDNAFADALVRALRQAGADVWYDEHNLGAGPLADTIQRELAARPAFVVVLSNAAFGSPWVKRETTWAYNLYTREPQRVILPVVATAFEPSAFNEGWLFLEEFKRVESPGYKPFPTAEAIARTLVLLGMETSTPVPASGGTSSARNEAYRRFFQGLIDDLRARHFTGARVAQPQSWYAFASGVSGSGCVYSASFASEKRARTELYIDGGNATANKALFDALASNKMTIEAAFGDALSWERLDDRRASRVAIYRPGSIEDDAATLQDVHRWLIDQLLRFKRVFGPLIGRPTA